MFIVYLFWNFAATTTDQTTFAASSWIFLRHYFHYSLFTWLDSSSAHFPPHMASIPSRNLYQLTAPLLLVCSLRWLTTAITKSFIYLKRAAASTIHTIKSSQKLIQGRTSSSPPLNFPANSQSSYHLLSI